MKYAGRLRKTLFNSIDRICEKRSFSFVSPDKDFTRRGKFVVQDIFKCLLAIEGTALSHELLNYFNFCTDTPTKSAFVQARAKIRPDAFESLFYEFADAAREDELFDRSR